MHVCNAQSPRSTADVAHAVRMVVWCGQIFFYYLIFLYDIYFVSKRFTFVPQRGSLLLGAVHYFGEDDNDVEKEHPAHFINIRGSLLLIESALLRVGKLSCSSLDCVEKVHFQFSGQHSAIVSGPVLFIKKVRKRTTKTHEVHFG